MTITVSNPARSVGDAGHLFISALDFSKAFIMVICAHLTLYTYYQRDRQQLLSSQQAALARCQPLLRLRRGGAFPTALHQRAQTGPTPSMWTYPIDSLEP